MSDIQRSVTVKAKADFSEVEQKIQELKNLQSGAGFTAPGPIMGQGAGPAGGAQYGAPSPPQPPAGAFTKSYQNYYDQIQGMQVYGAPTPYVGVGAQYRSAVPDTNIAAPPGELGQGPIGGFMAGMAGGAGSLSSGYSGVATVTIQAQTVIIQASNVQMAGGGFGGSGGGGSGPYIATGGSGGPSGPNGPSFPSFVGTYGAENPLPPPSGFTGSYNTNAGYWQQGSGWPVSMPYPGGQGPIPNFEGTYSGDFDIPDFQGSNTPFGMWWQAGWNRIKTSLTSTRGRGGYYALSSLTAGVGGAISAGQSYWASQYQAGVGIEARRTAGEYVSPYEEEGIREAAYHQGMGGMIGGSLMAVGGALTAGGTWGLAGGAIPLVGEITAPLGIGAIGVGLAASAFGRGIETYATGQARTVQAQATREQLSQYLSGLTGISANTWQQMPSWIPMQDTLSMGQSLFAAAGPMGAVIARDPAITLMRQRYQNIPQALSTLGQLGTQAGYSDIRAALAGGDWSGAADIASRIGAATGDAGLVAGMVGPVDLRDTMARLTQAHHVMDIQAGLQMGTARAGISAAGVQGLIGTGAGWQSVTAGMSRTAEIQRTQEIPRLKMLEGYARASQSDIGNLIAAQYEQQIATLQAQIVGTPQAMSQFEIGQRTGLYEAAIGEAGVAVQRQQYGGGSAAQIEGAMRLVGARQEQYARGLSEMSGLRGLSPDDVARMRTEAQRQELQAKYETPRTIADFGLGVHLSESELAMSYAQKSMTTAQLFGSPEAVGRAYGSEATSLTIGITGMQERLARGFQDPQERNRLEKEINNTIRERMELQTQEVRVVGEMNLKLAETKEQMSATSYSQATMMGIGGAASDPLWLRAASQAENVLSSAIANRQAVAKTLRDAGTPTSEWGKNQAWVDAQNREIQARSGLAQTEISGGNVPIPITLQRQQMEIQFGMEVSQHAFMPFANQQVLARLGMANVAQQISSIDAAYAERREQVAKDHPDLLPAFDLEHMRQRMGLQEQGMGYLDQATRGWQDRLLAGVVNAPGTFGYVAAGFSMREAAPYAQAFTGDYGTRSVQAQQYWLRMGQRVAGSFAGFGNTPGGFVENALSGALPTVQVAGPLNLQGTLIIIDPKTGSQTTANFRATSNAIGSGAGLAAGQRPSRANSQNG